MDRHRSTNEKRAGKLFQGLVCTVHRATKPRTNGWPLTTDGTQEGTPRTHRDTTEHEILISLKKMGLDKAPGPDGFIIRFLVREWGIIGPDVVRQIQDVFVRNQAPDEWMLSHLVLIPKIDHPSKPTHFRPLSVCSVYYRLLTKIIANRVKPLLSGLVSNTQMVFLKGHSIQKNILLMTEVMHTFQKPDWMENAFALKADLFKVFDTLDWRFLYIALRKFDFS
jgi:Reverse transcriptase (RNA-dependent DNA polymerase)